MNIFAFNGSDVNLLLIVVSSIVGIFHVFTNILKLELLNWILKRGNIIEKR